MFSKRLNSLFFGDTVLWFTDHFVFLNSDPGSGPCPFTYSVGNEEYELPSVFLLRISDIVVFLIGCGRYFVFAVAICYIRISRVIWRKR